MVAQRRTATRTIRSLAAWRPTLTALAMAVTARGCLISPDKDYPVGKGSAGGGATDGGGTGEAGYGAASTLTDGGATGAAGGTTPSTGADGDATGAAGGAAPSTGGVPSMCNFDSTLLATTLPEMLIWQNFMVRSGNVCAQCSYEPCGKMQVTWGTPTTQAGVATYKPTYAPLGNPPMSVSLAQNDGVCATQALCTVVPTDPTVSLSLQRNSAGWEVAGVTASVAFVEDACTTTVGAPGEFIGLMASDLESEIEGTLKGLKFRCP